jgi:hypothetical protein
MGTDPSSFTLWASEDEGKGIHGVVNADGVLTFVVEAGKGSPIRGTELFNRMMAFFGDRVRAVQGVWRKGHHGDPAPTSIR